MVWSPVYPCYKVSFLAWFSLHRPDPKPENGDADEIDPISYGFGIHRKKIAGWPVEWNRFVGWGYIDLQRYECAYAVSTWLVIFLKMKEKALKYARRRSTRRRVYVVMRSLFVGRWPPYEETCPTQRHERLQALTDTILDFYVVHERHERVASSLAMIVMRRT